MFSVLKALWHAYRDNAQHRDTTHAAPPVVMVCVSSLKACQFADMGGGWGEGGGACGEQGRGVGWFVWGGRGTGACSGG